MQVHWLLEKDPHEDDLPQVIAEIEKQGHVAVATDKLPVEALKELFPPEACVVASGSLSFVDQVRRHTPWVPGYFYSPHNLKCSTYFAYWGKYLLNRYYLMIPFGELESRFRELCGRLHIGHLEDRRLFIRPDSGSKQFTGGLISEFHFQGGRFYENYAVAKEALIVVARPQVILEEYRFLIVDKEVITGSLYKKNGEIRFSELIDAKAWAKAQEIASDEWQPDSVYVLDIFMTDSGVFLGEINSWSTSGWYSCDISKIIKSISNQAIKEYEDIYRI